MIGRSISLFIIDILQIQNQYRYILYAYAYSCMYVCVWMTFVENKGYER